MNITNWVYEESSEASTRFEFLCDRTFLPQDMVKYLSQYKTLSERMTDKGSDLLKNKLNRIFSDMGKEQIILCLNKWIREEGIKGKDFCIHKEFICSRKLAFNEAIKFLRDKYGIFYTPGFYVVNNCIK